MAILPFLIKTIADKKRAFIWIEKIREKGF